MVSDRQGGGEHVALAFCSTFVALTYISRCTGFWIEGCWSEGRWVEGPGSNADGGSLEGAGGGWQLVMVSESFLMVGVGERGGADSLRDGADTHLISVEDRV